MEYIGLDRVRNHVISAQCELANTFQERIENMNLYQAGQLYLMVVSAQQKLDRVSQALTQRLPENDTEKHMLRLSERGK